MGYSTDFTGEFTITPGLSDELIDQLNEFCATRHEALRPGMHAHTDEWNRPYTGPLKDTTEVGIWCQWKFEASEDADATIMRWDEGEKAYSMAEWAAFILEHHIPAGHVVTGEVYAQGEDAEDQWRMVAHEGVIHVQTPTIVWPDLEPARECPSAESPDGKHAHNDRGVCVLCGKYSVAFDTEPENTDRLPTYVVGMGVIDA